MNSIIKKVQSNLGNPKTKNMDQIKKLKQNSCKILVIKDAIPILSKIRCTHRNKVQSR